MEKPNYGNWRLNALDWIAIIIMIIGAINWGVLGVLRYNMIEAIFGEMADLTRLSYFVIGLAGIWCIISLSTHVRQAAYGPRHTAAPAH